MAQLGRISGPLLAENLLRNGADLTFSNDRTDPSTTLLFLDVNNNRIGVKDDTPVRDLTVAGTTQTINLISDLAQIGNLEFSTGKIENVSNNIFVKANNRVLAPTLRNSDIEFNDNYIETYNSNADLEFRANGLGRVRADVNNVLISQDLTINGTTNLNHLNLTGLLTTDNLIVNTDLTVDKDSQFEDIKISQNKITTTLSNSDINLSPAGAGTIELLTNTNVSGNLHATGNITMDGNLVIGDANTDNIIFNAEFTGNIIPDADSTYNIGSPTRTWASIEALLMNGQDISASVVGVGGSQLALRQGNIFYVAVNGSDTNVGDHQQGPFRTIKHALSVADSSVNGPTMIYIFPGEYEEELPLYIPPQTSVKGLDLRNCIIKPDTSSQSEDVFLMDGETTVEDLTIKDFYYDSLNDKGYAFRFNTIADANITSRSPYIRNITVITQGSVTSASDPRGFDEGDAGKGALVDGQAVSSSSTEASMLFHSCTFITPGVDAITMRSGVRVEWLNCFTYFANRGLYAINESTGRLGNDGSTIRYGAELRSIGSASVYGNIGAEADGEETLMYLINHNFAYIGAGKDSSNDITLVNTDNETIEVNSGRIYYTSQDAGGNFRVGDAFVVDFERGTTSLSDSDVALTGISSITVNTGGNETFINAEKIETGNWQLAGNTISALVGDGNFTAASGTLNFLDNVNMQSNLAITGNFTMSGANFTLGNATGDNVTFEADVASSILPQSGNTYNLGSEAKRWNYVYLNLVDIDGISITNNYISTTESSADLELRANGTGEIYFTSDVQVDNNLTTTNLTTLANTDLFTVLHTGNTTQIGNIFQTGNKTISGEITVSSQVDIEDIQIKNNFVSTTASNSDLELRASGTGVVRFNDDTVIDNNLTVNGSITTGDIDIATSLDLNELVVNNNIEINDNYITTTISNSNLELRAPVSKVINVENSLKIDNSINILGTTNLQDIGITGTFTIVGDTSQTGNVDLTGNYTVTGSIDVGSSAQLENILIAGNVATTTVSNSDLELRASSTGVVRFNENTIVDKNITVNGTINAANVNVNTSLDLNQLITPSNILIDDNFITTTESNSDLDLRANGTGYVTFQDLLFRDNIISTASSDLVFNPNVVGILDISSTEAVILPIGNYSQNTNTQGDIRYNSEFQVFQGYATANTVFNGVYSDDFLTRVRVNDTDNILRFDVANSEVATITDSVNLSALQVDDININGNTISTNITNSDLEFVANSDGEVQLNNIGFHLNNITNNHAGEFTLASTDFGYYKIDSTGALAATIGDTGSRRPNPEVGEIRYNTDLQYSEVYDGTQWLIVTGPSITVTSELMGEIVDEWSLILG